MMLMGYITRLGRDGRWSLVTVNVMNVVTFGVLVTPLLPLHVGYVLPFHDVDLFNSLLLRYCLDLLC